jgi:hypothetical protein
MEETSSLLEIAESWSVTATPCKRFILIIFGSLLGGVYASFEKVVCTCISILSFNT